MAKEKCDFKVDIPFKKGLAASLYITRPNTYVPLDENTIKLRYFKYGRYELDMVSLKTTKHLIIDVDYRDPITFTTQVFQDNTNPNLANFVQKNVVDVYVGDVVYFNVAPDSKGDPEFIPTCSDENAIIEIIAEKLKVCFGLEIVRVHNLIQRLFVKPVITRRKSGKQRQRYKYSFLFHNCFFSSV